MRKSMLWPGIGPSDAPTKALMDIELINAIGNSLADLTKRTVDLRGYL